MEKNEFIILMGVPASGKSTLAKELMEMKEYVYVNLDNIHKDNNDGLYGQNGEKELKVAEKQMKEAREKNKNVIFDAINASYRKRKHWIEQFKAKGYFTKIIFINSSVEDAIARNKMRENNGGHTVADKRIKEIYTHIQFPLKHEADEIIVKTFEKPSQEAIEAFDQELLITNPYRWIHDNGDFIEKYLPELHQTRDFLQYNEFHTMDVFNHTLKATVNISKNTNSLELILSALFHDLGKYYTRKFITTYKEIKYQILNSNDFVLNQSTDMALIKPVFTKGEVLEVQRNEIENVCGAFYGHENISSKLAYDICIRLGLTSEQSFHIANIIQLHMDMPHMKVEEIAEKQWNKFMLKCGFIKDELIILRYADATAK